MRTVLCAVLVSAVACPALCQEKAGPPPVVGVPAVEAQPVPAEGGGDIQALLDQMGAPPEMQALIKGAGGEEMDPAMLLMLTMMMREGGGGDEGLLFMMMMQAMRPQPEPTTLLYKDDLLVIENGTVYHIDLDTMKLLASMRYRAGRSAASTLAALEPMLDQAKAKAQAASCVSNVKQVCLALLMYAQDFDEVLPGETWRTDIQPYCKNTQILMCPGGADTFVGYAMNAALAGANLGDIVAPAETPMVFESVDPDGRPLGGIEDAVAPHDGMCAVGFADGQVKLMPIEALADLLKAAPPLQQ